MPVPHRPRRLLAAALPAALALLMAACSTRYPNSVFTHFTEFNRDIGYLFQILIWLGTFVFIFVEAILLYTIWRYRRRGENDRPEHVHGNTTLEILWTAIPALILAFIAVPTVRTIFRTQDKAKADALQVEVVGHQWWWEFRYPQYTKTRASGQVDTLVTANELYLPVGRTVNFTLRTQDVLHSFWIPQLGGKRDLIANHVNYLWFTPDSTGEQAWNGFCAEYCGASHANMRFKTFTVMPANFAAWTAHQLSVAAFGPPAAPDRAATAAPATTGLATANPATKPDVARPPVPVAASAPASDTTAAAGVQLAGFVFPHDKLPSHVIPNTPIPAGMSFNESLVGDAERGRAAISGGAGACMGCHTIAGNPVMVGKIGPNLTHVASRTTIAGGIYPNDRKHLSLWVKNARWMKPGVLMPTLGAFQRDPVTKQTVPQTGLTDQQIADIVAYLQALK
jgi:cytochrome c oxidase subunit 2